MIYLSKSNDSLQTKQLVNYLLGPYYSVVLSTFCPCEFHIRHHTEAVQHFSLSLSNNIVRILSIFVQIYAQYFINNISQNISEF